MAKEMFVALPFFEVVMAYLKNKGTKQLLLLEKSAGSLYPAIIKIVTKITIEEVATGIPKFNHAKGKGIC